MATVYLAHDVRDDRQVAVKVLLPDVGFALGPERFLREIELASRFSHPHILPLYDSGERDGSLFYVMPYVPGESVRAKLDREGQLAIDVAVRLGAEVATALNYAHEKGVIHRDIKPENILIEDNHALVVDFGIARAVAAVGEQKLTQTGVTIGTPHYMSPEQAMAEPNLDGRTDIYSLGCVIYEMLAGQPPFAGPSAQAVIARHALDQVPALTIVRQSVSPELEAVVMKSLAKVPADRFQTASEFAEALRDPTRLAPSQWMHRTGTIGALAAREAVEREVAARAARRRRRTGIVVAALLPLLAVGGWIGLRRSMTRTGASAAADAEARRVAVLYFDDLSSDHSLGYLANGLTEGLISDLSAVRGLNVVSKGGASAFRGSTASPDSIARTLGVGTLVRGSVEPDGNKLRVTVRLADAMSGADFERASFEQPAGAVLQLVDTLSQQVARMIRRRLGQEVHLRQQRQGTENNAAWALVQRGEQQLQTATQQMAANDTAGVVRGLRNADSLFAQAASLDPQWVEPIVLLGTSHYKASRFYGASPMRAAAWIDSGMAQASRALTVAPGNADALELRGTLRYWRWLLSLEPDAAKAKDSLKAAQQDLDSAVKVNPAQAGAWSVLSHLDYQNNDVAGAKLAAASAYDADAFLANADVILWRLFAASYDLEQFPEAIRWCDVGSHRFPTDPRFVQCHLYIMGTTAVAPDVPRAWRLADSLVALSPEDRRVYARAEADVLAAAVLARANLADSARHVLARSRPPTSQDPTHDVDVDKAYVWTVLGDKTNAVRELKIYLAANPSRGSDLGDDNNWMWRSLQDDPAFKALVHKAPP